MSANGKDLLRYRDLTNLGYGSRTKIWSMVKNGNFPPPIDFCGSPAWLPEDIQKFKESRRYYEMKEPKQLKEWRESHQTATA